MITYWNINKGISPITGWKPSCWVMVTCPDEVDINILNEDLGVPEDFLSDIADTDERSRFDTGDGWLMIILRIPHKGDPGSRLMYNTIPLGILLKGDKIITVCHQHTDMMKDFIAYHKKRGVGFIDATDMVFRLFLSASVWYLKYLRQVNNLIEKAKCNMEDRKIDNSDIISLSRLQDTLTYFATSIRGNETLLAKLKYRLPVDELDAELIDDVNTEMSQARETNMIYVNILSSIMETNANVINNDMNKVMRLLTSLNMIIMFPTLIASLFGMNLINGMEEWHTGFIIALALCTLSTLLSYWWFKRKDWL